MRTLCGCPVVTSNRKYPKGWGASQFITVRNLAKSKKRLR